MFFSIFQLFLEQKITFFIKQYCFFFFKKSQDLKKFLFPISSPDVSGKPFEVELYFFLRKKSDQRKLLFILEKSNCTKKLETVSRK
jgi:hypothetical protein